MQKSRITALTITALATLALTACGSEDSAKSATGAELIKKDTLTVCSDVPYPPFEDFDKSAPTGFKGFDVDIVETHHVRKLDAPSGTAKSLAEAVGRGLRKPLDSSRIHAIRAGDVVGEHAVTRSGPGERVTVAHSATSRDLFAMGALRMARWLAARPAGMHVPDDWFADFSRA